MKITFLLPTVGWSGGIRVVAIYAHWLAEHGHEVVLVSQAARKPGLKQRVKGLLQGKGWPAYRALPASHIDGLGLEHRVVPAGQLPGAADVPVADVLVSTWWETAEWASRLPPECGVRAYLVQGHEVFDFLPRDRCEATYRLPFHKIVVSGWLATVMADRYGDHYVDLVPNGVDHQRFNAPQRDKQPQATVGMLYHETPLKGMVVALQALEKLKQHIPALKVIAFGSTSPTGIYALPDYIDLHVSPPQEKLRELYASCDVWLTTSRSEGFNLMAMEAMACRTPVVSTRTGWPVEGVRDGVNGYLVDVDDVEAAVDAVGKVLELDDSGWQTMSAQAYASVEHATWESSCLQFEKALIRACERANMGEIAGQVP